MQRKNELSFLNIIFCLLVIFIHVTSAPITALSKESLQYSLFFVPWRLSAFVVQGFIFLSGLKMFLKKSNGGYKKFYISRLKKVALPYLIAILIFYFYFLWRGHFDFSLKALGGYILRGNLVSHFYFVITIVQFYALKPLWKFMINKIPPVISIILSVVLMFICKYSFADFLYNDRIFTSYLAYWVIGCYAGRYYESILNHIKKYNKVYISQFLIFAVAEIIFSYRQFVYGGIRFFEEAHFVYCISAILFAFAIATIISHRVMTINIFKKTDNASYYIYLIHPLFIFIINGLMKRVGIVDIGAGFIVRCVFTYTLSIFLSIAYFEIKNKLIKNSKDRG